MGTDLFLADDLARLMDDMTTRRVSWDRLDDLLATSDIILSTTGAPEPIVTLERWRRCAAKRTNGTAVIIDIAVPRDFDPLIHDGDRTCLFNIDDLKRVREAG